MKQIFKFFLFSAALIFFLFPLSVSAAAGNGLIEGTVLSAETNKPVAGASVRLQRIYPRKSSAKFRAESDKSGAFSVRLAPGTYQYLVRRRGFGTSEGNVVVKDGETVRLSLPLNPEALVTGRIVDSGRKPLVGIAVSLGKYSRGRTDSAGRFTLRGVNEGWYELSLDHSSLVPEKHISFSIAAGEKKDAGDVVVRKAGTLVIRMTAGNRPLTRAYVSLSGSLAYRYGRTDKRGVCVFTKLPPGSYSLQSYDERIMDSRMNVDVPEGKRKTAHLKAVFRPPTLSLDSPGRVVLPGVGIPLSLRGLWVRKAHVSVYAVAEARVLDGTADPGEPSTIPVDARTRVLRRSVTLKKVRNSFFRRASLKLPSVPPGLYLVEAVDGKTIARSSFLVTRLGLVAKASGAGTLLFAADLTDGHALADVEIRQAAVSADSSALPVLLGVTGADGLLFSSNRGRVGIIGRKNGNLAVFPVSSRPESQKDLKGYLYTERPAYRPGQTVYFKGVLRKTVGEGYSLPEPGKVLVTVADTDDRKLMEKEYSFSSSGSFNGECNLPEDPPLGDYSLRAQVGDYTFQTSFRVLEYRKPEFEVTASTAKRFHVGGDPVPVSLDARYYFGGPVAGGTVRYRVYSRPYYHFDTDRDDGDDYSYLFGGYADFLGEGEVVTDSSGKALITIETKRIESPRAYTVELDVADSGGREVSSTASFVVTPSLIALSVRSLSYLSSPDKRTDIRVTAQTWEGKPLSSRVLVTMEEQVFDKKSRTYSYRKLGEHQVVTDGTGQAVFGQLFPRPGYWRITATTTDSRGLKSSGEGWVWIWKEGYTWDVSYRQLGVELDKKTYRPGETARVIVKSPAAGAALLLTVEGRELYSRRVIPDTGSVQVVDIPVSRDMAPYVFVSAVMIHEGRFYSRTRTLKVDARPDLLELKVATDKDVYEPGETVRLSVSAEGLDSRPREAELSLAVVDEALFAVAPETEKDIYAFFRGTREHRVVTLNSFPRVYLGGAPKAGRSEPFADQLKGIKMRKVFKDTAFWLPVLKTGPDGIARAEFPLPDNLTTWRATAVGFTDRSEFGTGRHTFIARLDVMARLQPPRFLTVGDRVAIPGIITNMTDGERRVTGIFESTGLSLLGNGHFSGTVGPGGTLRRDMSVKAETPGEALLRMRALAGDRGDAMEVMIPVFPRGMKRVSQGNIVLRGTEGKTVVSLPEDAMDRGAVLELSLSPTLADSLNESLGELIDFPYGCVEQTMSRFLPAVEVKSLLGASRFSLDPGIDAKLGRVLDEGLRRLYDFQHRDGGWGWWKDDAVDPYLTAHVMYGFARTRAAGVPIRSDSYERGIQSLARQMVGAPLEALPALYRAYVLTGRTDEAAERRIEKGWRQLTPSLKVQYVQALLSSSRKERAAPLLDELKRDVKREGSAAWLKDDDAYSWWYSWRWGGSAVETTAHLLDCQLTFDPTDSLVPSLAEFLVRKRSGRWWNTTRGTATAVTALARYAASTGELEASYQADLFLNDRELGSYEVEKGRLVRGAPFVSVPMKDLLRGENRLRLEREKSGGVLYLSARLGYLVPPEAAGSSPGLVVKRTVYRLQPRRSANGWRMEYTPLGPGEKLSPGDDVEVRLTVDNKEDMNFVIIEDRLPAGFEVRDTRDDPRFGSFFYYWDWYAHRERHDEKMVFFLDELPAGRHEFRYVMYPELEGKVLALPASVWPMYVPSLRSESGLWRVDVER